MKHFFKTLINVSLFAGILISASACSDDKDETPEVDKPTIQLVDPAATQSSISFTVRTENATQCAYYRVAKSQNGTNQTMSGDEILSNGTMVSTENPTITIDNLTENTEYVIMAAAKNSIATITAIPITITTTATPAAEMELTITDVTASYDSITFSITPLNGTSAGYDVYLATDPEPAADNIMDNGKRVRNMDQPNEFTVTDLLIDTSYIIYAVVENGVDKVMSKYEVKTIKPTTTTFTNAALTLSSDFSMYTILMDNADYSLELNLYRDKSDEHRAIIEPHIYTYTGSSDYEEWIISSTTVFKKLAGGTTMQISDASVTVSYENFIYTLSGEIVAGDNQEIFVFDYAGKMSYPIDKINSGKFLEENSEYNLNLHGGYYSMLLIFGTNSIEGTHEVDGGNLKSSSIITFSNGIKHNFLTGSITITESGTDSYDISGEITLVGGYVIQVDLTNIAVEKENPQDDGIIFTGASANSEINDSGWMTIYILNLKNDEWSFDFEFGSLSSDLYNVAADTYNYASWSDDDDPSIGCIGKYRIRNTVLGTSITDLDQGTLVITKEGTEYTVEINMTRDSGDVIKAKYVGTIPCAPYY